MGLFSRIFGSDKVIDAGISGIDKSFYTAEEKADDNLNRIKLHMAFMKLYEPFKLAQRLLALTVGIPFVMIHFIIFVMWAVIVNVSHKMSGERYDFIVSQYQIMADMNNDTLGLPFLIILSFYFAGGVGEGIIAKINEGKSKK